ncbi:trifunctional MMPL family transporter/lysophospholipid acyltransferase/class I SAM-dependent methyltransferase [Flavihumibacter solisilvae]|uniref:Glycerol acyltransferase n=1 Tax=Flavihumibacter solisilvae TaxID=1349421 RepID=A0A0C1L4V2_9BACT|nr:trifunctional MMPL family transporter/lysophospholipid acyltransferase/class I SAM-dependent methyltransferase [Flavihumibacter solisilvae]KIC95137.1 glycerol acyltransferase [Flavihumibacter solisilvae]
MENIFVLIDRFFKKYRVLFWCFFVLSCGIPAFIAKDIRLEEDITAIIPQDSATRQLNEIFQRSKLLDKMIVTVSLTDSINADADSLVAFADVLAGELTGQLQPYVSQVMHQVSDSSSLRMMEMINEHLPVFLEEGDYAAIDSMISAEGVRTTLERNYRLLTSPAGLALKQFIARDLSGISTPALKKLQLLQFDPQFELYDNHILTRDRKNLIMFVSPAFPKNNTGANAEFLKRLDAVLDSLHANQPSIKATYFGGTAVAAGNAVQLRRDTLMTQGITLVFLVIFLAWYFRRPEAPIVILVPAVFGAVFSIACITLLKGSLSVIALGTGSVILGIAVNYSLHVFNHYRHHPDMEKVLRDLSHPMTIGGITTIGGFLCLQFVESNMLRDLGLFAALSLVGASLCSLVFLPQLIRKRKVTATHAPGWVDRLATWRPRSHKWIILSILGLTVFFAFFMDRVQFEPDMNRMNYVSPQLREAEKQVNNINAYALQSLYVVSSGPDLQHALQQNEIAVQKLNSLAASGTIKKYTGVSALLVSDSLQQKRIAQWNAFWTPERRTQLLKNLDEQGKLAGFSTKAFEPVKQLLEKQYSVIPAEKAIEAGGGLVENYLISKPGEVQVLSMVRTEQASRNEVYKSFRQLNGVSVIDMQYVTGKLVEMVRNDFNSISWMVALIVFTVLLISFGRLELALIAFIPMLITWVWILGIMALFGIKFNIVNIIISALIFGLGDDYSLFTLDGLLQEYKTGEKITSSFRSSILLSAITTVAGLGVLIFAKHPSLQSIALIAITGILCVVLVSQVMIPFLFRVLISNRTNAGKPPLTIWTAIKSVFAFLYFTVGALILSLLGFLLLRANPFAGERAKYWYHVLVSKFAWSLMYVMGNVKKRIINPLRENFEKPSVIVSNHQSFLDILLLIMLHPKIILLTNDWVWKSPVFGYVVRLADYMPVTTGVENNMAMLADRVKNGYSIAVFPEGTRSPDGKMKRFHKGAFFLADQLGVDVLPILLHGTGYTMSKYDFMLKDGTVTVEFLPRITPDNQAFGKGYAERTKMISRHFKSVYQQRLEQYEHTGFFREQLIANYLYKGPVLEWYIRIKTKLEKNYTLFDQLVPKSGKILDIGCGYGPMTYMLHFMSSERELTGVDYDEEKVTTANHCFSRNGQIRFVQGDVTKFEFEAHDAILLCDMLHYLDPAQQEQVIEKCMRQLLPGGRIIIREGNSEMQKRHAGTRLTEFFSTRVFGFNKTREGGLSFLSASMIRSLARKNGFRCSEIDENTFTSNIIFILEKIETSNES